MKRTTAILFLLSASSLVMEAQTVALRSEGMAMNVIEYGARIQSLEVDGQDVVLGFDTADEYRQVKQNFGAVVGRYIGRILGGSLTLDGQHYQLQTGTNGDCSHGGTPGFSQREWTIVSSSDSVATLRYVSPDGENGFPGELTLYVTYTLADRSLRIDYEATTTVTTVLNPSNHSFFNLSGDLSASILGEELTVDSHQYALYDNNKRVTGDMASVGGTPFDFTIPHIIGARIGEAHPQLAVTKGYDHCYELRNDGSLAKPVAKLTDRNANLSMEVYTTEPAMQIYTANSHNGSIVGKGGKSYGRCNGICFETMHFPDSPNKPQWPSTVLREGETFRSTTIFKFERMNR